jgi:hypothetical protein
MYGLTSFGKNLICDADLGGGSVTEWFSMEQE